MEVFGLANVIYVKHKVLSNDLKTELIRKSIHMLIAFVPLVSTIFGSFPTLILLGGGVLFYSYTEYQRKLGRVIPLVTRITYAAARTTDKDGIILGPVTLGVGAMVSLLLYPSPASIVAIYALAFGDSISAIVGKFLGRNSFPFLQGKTIEGSLSCLLFVFFLTYRLTGLIVPSIVIAVVATALEAIPIKDLDNILIPMGSGFAASLFLT